MIGVQFAGAAWVNAPGSVANDAYMPLHTGTENQIKAEGNTYGGLGVGTFFANLKSEFHADVHIGGTLGASTFAPKVYLVKFKDGGGQKYLCVDRSDGKLMVSEVSDCADLAGANLRGGTPSLQPAGRN